MHLLLLQSINICCALIPVYLTYERPLTRRFCPAGMVAGTLHVKILTEGVHSGASSGVVPSTFRIIRQLLSRIEDEKTGKVLLFC